MLVLQVERLSKLTETPVENMDETKRLEIINSTVNVDKRLVKLFELIETDLLANILHSTQTIAPYKVSSSPIPSHNHAVLEHIALLDVGTLLLLT